MSFQKFIINTFLLIILSTQVNPGLAQDNPVEPSNLKEKQSEVKIKKSKYPLEIKVIKNDNIKEQKFNPRLKGQVSELSRFDKFKEFIKGEEARDTLMVGMWSHHFSNNNYREVNNLGALQYKGYFIGTFANSHSDQTIAITAARTVYKKSFGEHFLFDAGYKIGPMYGYKEGVPDVGGFSILPVATFGLSYRGIGVAMNLFPANALSFHTFINLEQFKDIVK